jgi:hypothetical protein
MIEPPDLIEMVFRDGKRRVPAYIANLFSGIETHRLTYDESMVEANKKVEAEFINAQQDHVLAAHFREQR